jgi:hypothetical protein
MPPIMFLIMFPKEVYKEPSRKPRGRAQPDALARLLVRLSSVLIPLRLNVRSNPYPLGYPG